MKGLSIIIPAAGEGSRLGMEGAKELFEILPGKRLIDLALTHLTASPGAVERVILTLTPSKIEVFDYLLSLNLPFPVEYSLFNESYLEWPGSILTSAQKLDDDSIAAVLLPDSEIVCSKSSKTQFENGSTLLENFSKSLENAYFSLACLETSHSDTLASLGAVAVSKEDKKPGHYDVTELCDKPQISSKSGSNNDNDKYNAVWGAMAFRAGISRKLYELLINSVQNREPFSPEFNTEAFFIESYTDLGTPEAVSNYRKIYGNSN